MKFKEYLNEVKGYVVKVDKTGAPYTFLTTQVFKNDKERDKWIKQKLSKQKETAKIVSIKPL